jgi:hypothetical protein
MTDAKEEWRSKPLTSFLHICVACDWGEEVDLALATQRAPAEPQELARRPRTPKSIGFRSTPLRFALPPVPLDLVEAGACRAEADVTVFDFGAANVTLRVPLQLSAAQLLRLARSFASPEALVSAARAAAAPLFDRLRPAIVSPQLSDLSEEYFVFVFDPDSLPPPASLLSDQGDWLAGLLRLEDSPLSPEEVVDALRQRITYSPGDLVVVEWGAAVVIDRDCEETLQTLELANLQLLEYRQMDRRIDDALASAYALIHPLVRTWLPFWRTHAQPMRMLGDLRVETDVLFERTTKALKLVGDQYLARLYRLLAARFHLDEWGVSVRESLDVAQGVYQILSDQAATYRVELLEMIVIALILIEILMAWFGHG